MRADSGSGTASPARVRGAWGRIGQREEIARAVLFLAGDDAPFMTGWALVVDGGGRAD